MDWRKGKKVTALSLLLISTALGGCKQGEGDPRAAVEQFFSSAVRQDYATTYDCYYNRYKEKVSRDDFVKHRKEASVLTNYSITSLRRDGDTAQAVALLTFAPSEKLNRTEPATVKVTEDLVREDGGWKIKVW